MAREAERLTRLVDRLATGTSTIGELIDDIYKVREKIKGLTAQVSELEVQKAELEGHLLTLMDDQGVTQSRGSLASATRKVETVAQADDWEKLYPYISRTKSWQLLHRRLNNAAYRELLEQRNGKPIPGLSSFNKVSISLRSI
jgi:DNA repair exonuclease SbcCD ATPase subunit